MFKRILGFLMVALLLFTNSGTVNAQTYLFSVESTIVDVIVNDDGTFTLDYTITFLNDHSADPIDYVDIGVPTSSYSLSAVTAEIDGTSITDIEKSPYVSPGIAFGLGSKSIKAGNRGTVHVTIPNVKKVLYNATNEESEPYASMQFAPNYFGSEYVTNNDMDMTVTIFMPAGMDPDEPRWFEPTNWPGLSTPSSGYDDDGRIYYRWVTDQASPSSEYRFGASFPIRLVPETAIVKQSSSLNIDEDSIICLCFSSFFILIFGLGIYQSIWGSKKRKMKYLPPKMSIEGHGIKRGLTAIEAAILLENPMDKVLTMILFSVIKKGAAEVVTKDPLKLKIASPIPEGLRSYEEEFLAAFEKTKVKERTKELQAVMVALVKMVTTKMKGFSHKETVKYYETIMEKAWNMVEEVDTPDVKVAKYDEVMDWTMLDRDFDKRTRDVFVSPPQFYPIWWGRFDPSFRSAGGVARPSTPISSSSGRTFSVPNLPGSDFAASMVTGMQNFSSDVVGDVTSFTDKITNKTNPVPVRTSSSSGRSGGSSCACACACAGCACACAGGGR
ncbi:MAG: hypothetical protein JEZ00_20530 [Anaerolineaceae bacterium]|nr:hypothetical protein [Anaerolineaceae bacterium]